MTKFLKMVLIAGVSLGLAGCACPQKEAYTGGPYAMNRTAGSGIAVSEGLCLKPAPKMEETVEAPAPEPEPEPEPAPVAKRKAEKAFNDDLRK